MFKKIFVLFLLSTWLWMGCDDDKTSVPNISLSLSKTEVTAFQEVIITATLDAASGSTVTAHLQFSGSAVSNTDYMVQNTYISIPGGQLTGSTTISALEVDSDTPLNVVVSIESVSGANVGDPSSVTLNIVKETTNIDGETAIVYLANEKQVIRGFGGIVIPDWGNDLSETEAVKVFGTSDGQIGLSILRIRIPYNSDNFYSVLDVAKQAKSMGVTLFASPWTPPASMKTSNDIVGGELKPEYYADYANHLKSFVDYLAANDAGLYAVSIQNEPDIQVSYESCDWNASQMIDFLTNHAPSIGEIKIMAPESFQFKKVISNAILNDDVAAANVDIIGGHIYGGGLENYPLALEKGKEVWMTEHFINNEEEAVSDWEEALMVATEIDDCMNANMSAYIWWYIRRFYGPIDEDGSVTRKGFVMSNFARFVRPGFIRVESTANPNLNIQLTSYKDGDKVVLVVINSGDSSVNQLVMIEGANFSSLVPYVTTDDKDFVKGNAVSGSENSFVLSLEASSVTTFVSE